MLFKIPSEALGDLELYNLSEVLLAAHRERPGYALACALEQLAAEMGERASRYAPRAVLLIERQ